MLKTLDNNILNLLIIRPETPSPETTKSPSFTFHPHRSHKPHKPHHTDAPVVVSAEGTGITGNEAFTDK